MSEAPKHCRFRFSVRMLLIVVPIAAILVWQASIVHERKALLTRARAGGVYVKYGDQATLLRALLGDRAVWSIDIPPDSEFYGHTTKLRRAFPEAYINHLAPAMQAVNPAVPVVPIVLDVPPSSPPVRSAWWGF
ncbi:hypothetical protein [Lacipirellula sp.]|uniref:hypothetical protein n=1 Tax=Lacipirellula sp. TaxID=2691419 RepID=UPI003D0FA7E2